MNSVVKTNRGYVSTASIQKRKKEARGDIVALTGKLSNTMLGHYLKTTREILTGQIVMKREKSVGLQNAG